MRKIRGTALRMIDRLAIAPSYLTSYYKGRENEELFGGVETYCMFIGYPRSGHSLLGSLLDAHPNVIIAHELDALKYISAGFGKRQLYQLLLDNSRGFARRGRRWTGYTYEVPNQWQGRFEKLRIIGDKKGGRSTLRLARKPKLLSRLQEVVATDLKFIHVVRNPFDNIATMYKRAVESNRTPTLRDIIENYFSRCEANAGLKERLGDEAVIDVYHESLIEDTKSLLRELCGFLRLGYENDYLNDCASIVFKSANKSRYGVEWDDGTLAAVRDGINRFDFLEGYSYED